MIQNSVNPLSQCWTQDIGDVLDRSSSHTIHASKSLQEHLFSLFPNPWNFVELGMHDPLPSPLSMILDSKSVGLIANALDKLEGRCVVIQSNRVTFGRKDDLFSFRDGGGGNVNEPHFPQHFLHCPELPLPPINENKIRENRCFGLKPCIATANHFLKRQIIVLSMNGPNPKSTIFVPTEPLRFPYDHGAHCFTSLEMGDIERLDTDWEFLEMKLFLELF